MLGEYYLKLATTSSFHTLFNSSTYHPFIRRIIVSFTEKASLNKVQVHSKHLYIGVSEFSSLANSGEFVDQLSNYSTSFSRRPHNFNWSVAIHCKAAQHDAQVKIHEFSEARRVVKKSHCYVAVVLIELRSVTPVSNVSRCVEYLLKHGVK
jgi:hypothetical protein